MNEISRDALVQTEEVPSRTVPLRNNPKAMPPCEEGLFLEKIISSCPDGVIAVDRKGKIIIFNEASEQLTGHKREEVIGKASITDVYHPSTLAREIKKKLYGPDYGGVGRLEGVDVEVMSREGRKIPIRLSGTLLYKNGEEIGSVGFFHDLTPRREMEARLLEMTITDPLTGLYNHRHFYTVLSDELARARRYRRTLALIALDVDDFKTFNDNLGHLEGDNILRGVAKTLWVVLRKTDKAFRYGGDEFMVILPETTLPRANITAEKIRKGFKALWPRSFSVAGGRLEAPALSLGVAEAGDAEEIESLIKRADLTMYEAKKAGGNRSLEARPKLGKPVDLQVRM